MFLNVRWDAFNQTEDARSSASEKHTDFIKKASICLKITTTLFTFCVVLVAGGISKGALFFMIAQVRPLSIVNVTSGDDPNKLHNPPLEYCSENIPSNNDKNSTYEVHYGEEERIAWMW